MIQFLEFIGNHPVLTVMWMITLGAIIFYHRRTSASSVAPQEAIMMINRKDAVVIDVRERKEFDAKAVVGVHYLGNGLSISERLLFV